MATEFQKPDFKAHLNRDYFAEQARIVAPDLLGRLIIRQFPDTELVAKIKEVAAWQGATKTTARTAKYAPGMVGISRKFGKYLIDIATGSEGTPSCITLIALETPTGVIQGPGNLSNYLQIDEKFDSAPIDHPCLWIAGEPISQDRIVKRSLNSLPENCKGYFYYK